MDPHYAYVQARLQARNGMRPDSATWAQLEAIRDPARFLDVARKSRLADWVQPLRADMDVHAVERVLRMHLRAYIVRIALWYPQSWRAAFHWTARLLDLPEIQYLLNGGEVLAWMRDDEALHDVAQVRLDDRAQAFARDRDLAPLARAHRAGIPLRHAWRREWEHRWPPAPTAQHAALSRLANALEHTLPPLPDEQADSLSVLIERLPRVLGLAFRRNLFQPAEGVIHIALVALDMIRLRSLLLPRMLFPPREAAA